MLGISFVWPLKNALEIQSLTLSDYDLNVTGEFTRTIFVVQTSIAVVSNTVIIEVVIEGFM